MNIRGILFTTTILFICCACGTVKRGTVPWKDQPSDGDSVPVLTATPVKVSKKNSFSSREEKEVKERLQRAFKDWKGVPYVLGGAGYDGVDCSSFMQIVFEDYFLKQLPRNTSEQFGVGSKIRQSEVRTGDLVFFKTGVKTFHVGVMVNEDEFMHASTSQGVMISSLQNRYWQDVYYTARRVL